MAVGRFVAMVGMLVWHHEEGLYLLLRRSPTRDHAPGEWESGSGRLEQGEGFIEALLRSRVRNWVSTCVSSASWEPLTSIAVNLYRRMRWLV